MQDDDLILSVDGLSVSAGDKSLLRDVSFEIRRGEMLCVVGESGAGKSTLLKALQGLMHAKCTHFQYPPATINLSGEMPQKVGLPRSRWVMQDPLAALNPRMTLGVSILESLHRQKSSAGKSELVQALAAAELPEEYCHRYPDQVSLGQAQRACLARALIAKPDLIFFDEPLSALDAMVQKKIALRLEQIRVETGASYLVVTHDLGYAATYADHILVLKDGLVEAYQTRDEILTNPASSYAASLVEAARDLGALEGLEQAA